MVSIQIGVSTWNKSFLLLDIDNDEEVGRVVGEAVGYIVHKLIEYREQGKKEVKE